MTTDEIKTVIAKAINGPHLPPPAGCKHTLQELRDTMWKNVGAADRQICLNQAAAVLALVGPKPLIWTGTESDCYMQVSTAAGVYCIGVINDGWYAEFEAHAAPKPHSLGWHYDSATSAQAAAQAHADAAHWANTPLGKLVGV